MICDVLWRVPVGGSGCRRSQQGPESAMLAPLPLAGQLQDTGVQLELLTGQLTAALRSALWHCPLGTVAGVALVAGVDGGGLSAAGSAAVHLEQSGGDQEVTELGVTVGAGVEV